MTTHPDDPAAGVAPAGPQSGDAGVQLDVASARRAPASFDVPPPPPRREHTLTQRIRRLSHAGIERPAAATAAVVLLWIFVAIGFVSLFVVASLMSAAALERPALWLVPALAALVLVLEAVVIAFVARGARWARVVLTVLVVVRVVLPLLSGEGIDLSGLVSVGVLVLLYLPRSNEWFAAGSR